ncbi:MAG: response regulator [Phycisphaerae bacterium]|nr:response regulator [Phycisphaerae bacterium]
MDRKKILIVDDEDDDLWVLGKGLAAEGYSVITASCGNDAISLAKSKRPDVLILDVLMPDVDGPEVSRRLREDPGTKGIPIIFLTGMLPKREDYEDGHLVAGYVLFDKPYDILKLVSAIEELLREKVAL